MSSENIKMDVEELEHSMSKEEGKTNKKKLKNQGTTEETVEDLIAKLEARGKKIIV